MGPVDEHRLYIHVDVTDVHDPHELRILDATLYQQKPSPSYFDIQPQISVDGQWKSPGLY